MGHFFLLIHTQHELNACWFSMSKPAMIKEGFLSPLYIFSITTGIKLACYNYKLASKWVGLASSERKKNTPKRCVVSGNKRFERNPLIWVEPFQNSHFANFRSLFVVQPWEIHILSYKSETRTHIFSNVQEDSAYSERDTIKRSTTGRDKKIWLDKLKDKKKKKK